MRRLAILLCAALLLLTAAAAEDWDEEELVFPGRVENGVLILDEGVTALGWYTPRYTYDPETEEWTEEEDDPEKEALFDGTYNFSTDMYGDPVFYSVQWPASFKYLGGESFVFYHFRELTLPATLEIMGSYAVTGDIDVLRIEATLPWDEIGEIRWDHNGMDNVIGAYEVPEGHPVYRAVDGVLFSSDGKTLLAYPNGRKDTHYDVPKGVEAIAAQAFRSEYLQTVSLPIGLRSVGDYAFSGCTRLQSIALPLTVTELGHGVFDGCVSLELVSLPEGLQADKETNSWYVRYQDDSLYRGDNGDTIRGIAPASSSQNILAPGRLTGPEEKIGVYSNSKDTVKGQYLSSGSVYWMSSLVNGRVGLKDPFTFKDVGWADAENVEYLPSETLFSWADAKPGADMRVWFTQLPYPGEDRPAWTATAPEDDYWWRMYGPFVMFEQSGGTRFACPVQDADLTRETDGTDSVYAIVYNEDVFRDIPLLSGPGGEITEYLIGGTQIRVLEEDELGYSVTTGIVSGWAAKEYVKIIPEKGEGN